VLETASKMGYVWLVSCWLEGAQQEGGVLETTKCRTLSEVDKR
jgi:hypothetical protein